MYSIFLSQKLCCNVWIYLMVVIQQLQQNNYTYHLPKTNGILKCYNVTRQYIDLHYCNFLPSQRNKINWSVCLPWFMKLYFFFHLGIRHSPQHARRETGRRNSESGDGFERGHDCDGFPGPGDSPADYTGQCQWLCSSPLARPRHSMPTRVDHPPAQLCSMLL